MPSKEGECDLKKKKALGSPDCEDGFGPIQVK